MRYTYSHIDFILYALIRAWDENVVSCIGHFKDSCLRVLHHSAKPAVRKHTTHKVQEANMGHVPEDFGPLRFCALCGMRLDEYWDDKLGENAYRHPVHLDYAHLDMDDLGDLIDNEVICRWTLRYLEPDQMTTNYGENKTVYTHKYGDPEGEDTVAMRELYRNLNGKDLEWRRANIDALKEIYKDNHDDAGRSKYETYIPAYHNGTDWVYMDRFTERDVVTEIDAATHRTKEENRTLRYLSGGHDPNILFGRVWNEPDNAKGWREVKRLNKKGKVYTEWIKVVGTHGDGSLLTNHFRALRRVEDAYKTGNMGDSMYERLKSLCEYVSGYFWHPRTIRYRATQMVKKNNHLSYGAQCSKMRREQIDRQKDHGEEKVDAKPSSYRSVYHHLAFECVHGYDWEQESRQHEFVTQHNLATYC